MSGAQKEMSLTDIDEMLRKTNAEIELKERSIKSMEKSLANARNRLEVLNGRKGILKLERIKKKHGIQSDDELEELMGRIDAKLANEPTAKPDVKEDVPVPKEADGKEAPATTEKTKHKKADEPAADYSKMW